MDRFPPASPPPLRPGAVLHGPGSQEVDRLLQRFAATLIARGFRVEGVIQRNTGAIDDCAERMELVDVATGHAYNITQNLGSGSQSCKVDPMGVAEASTVLRRALGGGADLLIVNKFAGLEAGGSGLSAEMLAAMADGMPVLTSVGSRFTTEWVTFTGGYTDLLCPDMDALWRWWGPHRLYRDLVLGVAGDAEIRRAEIRRVVIGAQWIMVDAGDRVGLASRPAVTLNEPLPPPDRWVGRGLLELAEQAASGWDSLTVAAGVAALNAFYNHSGVTGSGGNGLDLFRGATGRVVVIGSFPGIQKRLPHAQVVDFAPKPGEYPAAAGDWLLAGAEGAAITASALANRTLPGLLSAARGARVALIGPGTPLTPRLFDYGIDSLCGFVAQDVDRIAAVILAGGSSKDFHRFGRFVTQERPAGA